MNKKQLPAGVYTVANGAQVVLGGRVCRAGARVTLDAGLASLFASMGKIVLPGQPQAQPAAQTQKAPEPEKPTRRRRAAKAETEAPEQAENV